MTPSPPEGYRIRPTARADIPLLPAIERDAAEVFRSVGLWGPAYEGVRGLDQHERAVAAGIGWVATRADEVCAFALGSIVDGHLHLHELAVGQAHQRRGLGAALLAVVIDHARWRFDPVITLTTHRDVPWNGPFYRRYGFIEIDGTRLPPGMKRILDSEAAEGFDPSQRCAMAKVL
jgi:GNAT superfamily N-acetyltransferase